MNSPFQAIQSLFLVYYGLFFEMSDNVSDRSPSASSESLIMAIDIMLAERYHIYLSPALRDHLKTYDTDDLLQFWSWFEKIWKESGKFVLHDERMTPFFRQFPNNMPENMETLWIKKVLTFLPTQDGRCNICHKKNTLVELEPCHHTACVDCFNGYTGCPVCGQPIDIHSTFLQNQTDLYKSDRGAWKSMQCLNLGQDIHAFAKERFLAICKIASAITNRDKEILQVLLETYNKQLIDWFPKKFASKQAQAIVLGYYMKAPWASEITHVFKQYLKNPTDILRLITLLSGQDGTLMPHIVNRLIPAKDCSTIQNLLSHFQQARVRRLLTTNLKNITISTRTYNFQVVKMSRSQRRFILELLNSFDENVLKEDLHRHKVLWIRVGEFLHPGEYQNRYPKIFRAFQSIRKKFVSDGKSVRAPKFKSWRSRLEEAIAKQDDNTLITLMHQHPGEFARHIDRILRGFANRPTFIDFASEHLIRNSARFYIDALCQHKILTSLKHLKNNIAAQFSAAKKEFSTKVQYIKQFKYLLTKLPTPMLIQLWGHFGTRNSKLKKRVFYPAGTVRKIYWRTDTRYTIPLPYVISVREGIVRELLSRFEQKSHFDQSIIDESLKTLTFPFGERTNQSTAIQISPGSSLPIPPEDKNGKIRLFLHWCQHATSRRVDLDLSVAFFNSDWVFHDGCAYYNLICQTRHSSHQTYCKHSGDFQAAPYPGGATEYVDIDRSLALKDGIRYAVVFVQVFAGIDFNDLERAYAGVMYRQDTKNTAAFDPLTVRFKYSLEGEVEAYAPIYFDLQEETIHDIQCYLPKRPGHLNNLRSNKETVQKMAEALSQYYSDKPRPMRYDIALMQAAARSKCVWLRREDGSTLSFVRRSLEDTWMFYQRILKGSAMVSALSVPKNPGEDIEHIPEFETPSLAFLRDGDLPLDAESEYYIVIPDKLAERRSWSELME